MRCKSLHCGIQYNAVVRHAALAVVLASIFVCQACAQESAPTRDTTSDRKASTDQRKVAQVANLPGPGSPQTPVAANGQAAADHPLVPALKIAQASLAHIKKDIRGYSCLLQKCERVNDELIPREYISTKIRREPFSIYMRFQGPKELEGRECLYVAGQNDEKLIAHEGSGLLTMTARLDPKGFLAMRGQRYPITEVGIGNLTERLIQVAQKALQFDECEVKFRHGSINLGRSEKRACTFIEVIHPVPRKHFRFHLARIAIDDELQVPIHYEAYLWPEEPGGKMLLDETYTYTKLKINPGLTDRDFDPENPDYNF